jgi:hypothetical protein
MRARFSLLALPLVLLGCKNDCQKLCDEMAAFAEECGSEWERADIKECRKDHGNSDVSKEGREACADALPTLTEEWTCDDLEAYFEDSSDDDGGGDDGGGSDSGR